MIAVAIGVTARAQSAATPGADARDDDLVLGRVSDDPKNDYPRLKPLLDYVLPRMAEVGIRGGHVLMARDNQQMMSYLRRGKVDWVTETAGSAMSYEERARAQPILLSERGGLARYQSVIFARRDSGIRTLADLRGRTIALQGPASTSAYMLPAIEILGAKLPLLILASPADRPSPDVVGFVFARSELNISTWVHKGLVDAGAFSEQDWSDLERMPTSFRADLVEVHRTRFAPRALELTRPGLDARVRDRLRQVLLDAARDPNAAPALRAYWNTSAFLPIDDASQAELADLRRAVVQLRAEVE